MKCVFKLLFISILCIYPTSLVGQINDPIQFSAENTDSLMIAECRFYPQPEYGKESILQVTMHAINDRLNNLAMRMKSYPANNPYLKKDVKRPDILKTDNSIEWIMTAGPAEYVSILDSVYSWKPEIKTGDSLVFKIPCTFEGVGEFNFVLANLGDAIDQIKLQFVVVLDEEGRAAYIGKYPPPYDNPLGAHVYCFGDTVSAFRKGKEIFRREMAIGVLEPFDVVMNIIPTPKVGIKSEVKLSIVAMSSDIEEIQYELMHARKLKIDTIAESQGENPGKGERFETSFEMTPVASGRAFLSFEVFGYYQGGRHSNIISSKVSYNMIFGADSSLLYMGVAEPFEAGFEAGNPAYKKIEGIADFKDAKIGYKTQRSMPDFQYDRKNHERIRDSLQKIEQDKKK